MSLEVADILLDIQAVHYYDKEPFKLTSGTPSPVYVDCRKLISFPDGRSAVLDAAVAAIKALPGPSPEVIAGGETAGIPYAAFVAERLHLPMIYIRKKPKEFGRKSRIEGFMSPGARVLLVEDLIFDAQSKLAFAEGIRDAGGVVDTTLVVFEYGRPTAHKQLADAGLRLISLVDWNDLLTAAVRRGIFSPAQESVVRRFLADPAAWVPDGA
jgi:orotate phosphoribosyltransferase